MDPKKYKTLSEDELLQLYNDDGDQYAFLELYKRHRDKLIGFFRKRAGKQLSTDLYKDLLQDTYCNLLNSGTFKENSIRSFGDYIMTTAFHTWSAYIKKENKRMNNKKEWGDLQKHQLSVQEKDEKEKGKIIDIDTALASLPDERMKTALSLWYKGLSYREIAEIMDTTEAVVRNLIHRAKQFLRNNNSK